MNEDTSVVSGDTQDKASLASSQEGQKPAEKSFVATEKSDKPTEESKGDVEAQNADSKKSDYIPYERFKEVNSKMKEYEQDALLLRKMQQDPSLAQAMLRNVQMPEVDPVKAQADKTLREMGYVRSEDVQTMVMQELERREFERGFVSKINELASTHNGSDGFPKFEPEEIARFMDESGIKDPEIAYEYKHREEIADARVKSKRSSAFSEKPGQPMQTLDKEGSERDLEEAKKTGDFSKIFKRYVPKIEE